MPCPEAPAKTVRARLEKKALRWVFFWRKSLFWKFLFLPFFSRPSLSDGEGEYNKFLVVGFAAVSVALRHIQGEEFNSGRVDEETVLDFLVLHTLTLFSPFGGGRYLRAKKNSIKYLQYHSVHNGFVVVVVSLDCRDHMSVVLVFGLRAAIRPLVALAEGGGEGRSVRMPR